MLWHGSTCGQEEDTGSPGIVPYKTQVQKWLNTLQRSEEILCKMFAN